MNCPNCGVPLAVNKNKCDRCGEEVVLFRKIIRASNALYNEGLAKAKVRDLTGAMNDLKKSLKMNKKNIDSRNLLGLIYYEMGEVVDAISEWVLSKHFQGEDNQADYYLKTVQTNLTKLDLINQAIKKYNIALASAKQGSEDLAIIQLKKVTSLNPHFIRAYQLLALLYMKNNDKEKAKKTLQKISAIDVNNTTCLRYLQEITGQGKAVESIGNKKDNPVLNELSQITPVSSYKEDKPNVFVFINLILGIAIGFATFYILFVPTMKKNLVAQYNTEKVDYSEELSVQTATIATLEGDKQALQAQIDTLNKSLEEYGKGEYDVAQYDVLFEAVGLYIQDDKEGAARILVDGKTDKIESGIALDIYNLIKEDTFEQTSTKLYNTGHQEYSAGKYEESIKTLEDAVAMDESNVNAIYFIGRAYHRLGESEKAGEYYNRVVRDFPDTKRANEAKSRLAELNQ